MTTSVFYSFHFDRDVSRVQMIRNIGALDATEPVSKQDWESLKEAGDEAVKKWIADQMAGKSAAVVLVGAETASRRWVRHEIAHAWNNKIPLVGVRIHGLKNFAQETDAAGPNPFDEVSCGTRQIGMTPLSSWVTLHNPTGSDSKEVYASIAENIESWAANAYQRS